MKDRIDGTNGEQTDQNRIPNICALILGAVAFFMLFAPTLMFEYGGSKLDCSGLNLAFGTALTQDARAILGEGAVLPPYVGLNYSLSYFIISPLAIAYLAVLGGVICAALDFFGIGKKVAPIVSASCFAVAGVLFFIANYIVLFNPEIGDFDFISALRENLKLGFGAIVGGTFSCISFAAMLSGVFLKKPHVKISVEY